MNGKEKYELMVKCFTEYTILTFVKQEIHDEWYLIPPSRKKFDDKKDKFSNTYVK
jgi:hypothetical protein